MQICQQPASAAWGGPWGIRRRRKLRCTAIPEEPSSRNTLFCWPCLRVDRSFVLRRAVIDQLANRRARFQPGETLVDLVELECARDQMIEFQPSLAPQ